MCLLRPRRRACPLDGSRSKPSPCRPRYQRRRRRRALGQDHIPRRGEPHHDVRPRHRRHEPRLSRRGDGESHRGRRHHRAADVRAGGRRSSTRTTSCARSPASRGSAPAPRGRAGVDGKPSSSGGLHAEQHYEYHRPLRAGDVLTAETKPGKTWEKESKRAGKLMFSERVTEYRDQNGELVVTARGVGVRTERPVRRRAEGGRERWH